MRKGVLRLPSLAWVVLAPFLSWTGSAIAQAGPGIDAGGNADGRGEDVVLLDGRLPDSVLLARAVSPAGRVFLYDSAGDSAVDVLTRVVAWAKAAHAGVASLSILSHGTPGAFELGNDWISTARIARTAGAWQDLGGVLVRGARIDLYGCSVAAPGSDGPRLLDELARLTGAVVFASDNVTGRGGDWKLEASSSGAARDIAASGPPRLDAALLESSGVTLSWYDPGWNYRKQVTIHHTQVAGGADLTSFPVLVNLASDANLAAQAQSSGNDILFTGADGATKLAHEIESYTSGTGALVVWIGVPSLSASVDTVLYMYYGNAGAPNQQNPTAVWDSNYHGVWHLAENGTLAKDSTTNANNATSGVQPTQAVGQIGNGQSFDGSTQFLDIPDAPSLDIPMNGTFSVWFKVADLRQSDLFQKGLPAENYGYTAWQDNTNLWWGPQYGTAPPGQWSEAPGALAAGQWYRLDGVSNPSGYERLYLNGTFLTQSAAVFSFSPNSTLEFGRGQDGFFHGTLDELRISNIVRSDGWILTEYNNQSSPSTFYSLGPENGVTLFFFKKREIEYP